MCDYDVHFYLLVFTSLPVFFNLCQVSVSVVEITIYI